MSTWHKVEIVTTEDGKGQVKQAVEGNSKAVAAWLRAVAEQRCDALGPRRRP